MRLTALSFVLCATASAFSPHAPQPRRCAVIAATPVRCRPQMALANIASSVNVALYAAMGLVAGNGLITKVPRVIGGEITGVQTGDVAIDAALFCVAVVQLGKMAVRRARRFRCCLYACLCTPILARITLVML